MNEVLENTGEKKNIFQSSFHFFFVQHPFPYLEHFIELYTPFYIASLDKTYQIQSIMSQQRVKRHMQTAIEPAAPIHPDVAALPSVAMRIRKAVSEGYQLPGTNGQQFQRVPLPNNMATPPELSDSFSTRTTSNLEEWDSYYMINNAPVQTMPGTNYMKRKFEEDKPVELGQYQARYGELRFNEEF